MYHAFVEADERMAKEPFDTLMSGTTGIVVLVRDQMLYVANVGDSRATCSVKQADGRLVALDLSDDQTPFRKDEIARVRREGAMVMTLDQLEGLKDPHVDVWVKDPDEGDPPRIWLPGQMFPGAAFTRSIGDKVAARVGVFAEPEIIIKHITPEIKHIVLASDGIFEFMSSQKVVDFVKRFDDLDEACVALCSESYRLWLENEPRTDDITVIVLELSNIPDTPGPADVLINAPPRGQEVGGVPAGAAGNKVEGTKASVTTPLFERIRGNYDEEDAIDISDITVRLTPEDMPFLDAIADESLVLADVTAAERQAIHRVVRKLSIKKGESVFTENTASEGMHVLIKGVVDVMSGGRLVQRLAAPPVSSATMPRPPCFGELGLLYGKERTTTALASEDCEVLYLDRRAMKAALKSLDIVSMFNIMAKVDAFKALLRVEFQEILDVMRREQYEAGDVICRQGALEEKWFIVLGGSVDCYVKQPGDNNSNTTVPANVVNDDLEADFTLSTSTATSPPAASYGKLVLNMGPGQHFGERALGEPSARSATVVAHDTTTLLALTRSDLHRVVGPLADAVADDLAWRRLVGGISQPSTTTSTTSTTVASNRTATLLNATTGRLKRGASVWGDGQSGGTIYHLPGDAEDSPDETLLVRFAPSASSALGSDHRRGTSAVAAAIAATFPAATSSTSSDNHTKSTNNIHPHAYACAQIPIPVATLTDPRGALEVLDVVPGKTLKQLAREAQPLQAIPVETIKYIAAHLVHAVEALHRGGVTHRGLAGDAIVVSQDGAVVVADTGHAKSTWGRTYTLCGSPEYLAPEMLEMRGHTQAVDWWALGVILYELGAGDTPFGHAQSGHVDELTVYFNIIDKVIEYPPHFPPALKELTQGLLHRTPHERLGYGFQGLRRLKANPFLAGVDWAAVARHAMPVPGDLAARLAAVAGRAGGEGVGVGGGRTAPWISRRSRFDT